MLKKFALFAVVFVLAASSAFAATPVPPAKGQWAIALESTLPLYRRANSESDFADVDMPNEWLKVPSATRDSDNYLWYKVTVDGETGWLPQNGVRLKMGPKSKNAANLYNNYVKTRRKVMNNPKGWSVDEYDGRTSYTSDNTPGAAEFRVITTGKRVEDVFFTTDDPKICRQFFGVNLIGKYQPEVRKRLGTPTMRESPVQDKNINILSYELEDRDITLTITERRDYGDDEGKVIAVELFRGRTGEPY